MTTPFFINRDKLYSIDKLAQVMRLTVHFSLLRSMENAPPTALRELTAYPFSSPPDQKQQHVLPSLRQTS